MPALWQGPDPLGLGPNSGGSDGSDDVDTVESDDDDQDGSDLPTMEERAAAFGSVFGGAASPEHQVTAPDPADTQAQSPQQPVGLPVSPAVILGAIGLVLLLRGGL